MEQVDDLGPNEEGMSLAFALQSSTNAMTTVNRKRDLNEPRMLDVPIESNPVGVGTQGSTSAGVGTTDSIEVADDGTNPFQRAREDLAGVGPNSPPDVSAHAPEQKPATDLLADVMFYDTTDYALSSARIPKRLKKQARLRESLDAELRQRYMDGYSIDGVEPGSSQELIAMQGLLEWSRLRTDGPSDDVAWGSESDLLVPSQQGSLRMTARQMDGTLAAAVHAVPEALASAPAFATVEAAVAALQADFGIRAEAGTKNFSLSELNQVYQAVRLLPTEEQAALRGLDLRRSDQPTPEQVKKFGHLSGLYESNAQVVDGARVRPPSITLYDRAFDGNAQRFVGDGSTAHPSSFTTIVHEFGHPVSLRKVGDAYVDWSIEGQKQEATADEANERRSRVVASKVSANEAISAYKSARASVPTTRAQRRQTNTLTRAGNRVVDEIGGLMRASGPAAVEAGRQAVQEALEEYGAALTALDANHPLRPQAEAMHDALQLHAADVGAHELSVVAHEAQVARTERAAAAVEALAASGTFVGGAYPASSAVVESFAEMIDGAGERPATEYGFKNDKEAFAEAYMLYRLDPEFLKTYRPKTHAWFEAGHHLP